MLISQATLNEVFPSLTSTLLSALAVLVITITVYHGFKKRFSLEKQRQKFRSRLIYVAVSIFIISLIKIWVSGFTHILTMLSLVAAGLVVTNKETIMNLVGWLIITWRGLFAEEDKIEINSLTGYVAWIGPLYFKLYETADFHTPHVTGKTIKIPNGLVLTHPVKTFTPANEIIRHRLQLRVTRQTYRLTLQATLAAELTQIMDDYYKAHPTCQRKSLALRNTRLARWFNFSPSVEIKPCPDSAETLVINLTYSCYANDIKTLEQQCWQMIFPLIVEQEKANDEK